MPSVKIKPLARHAEGAGRFEIFRKIKATRASPVLLKKLNSIFYKYARGEADRATRRWYAARREEGVPTAELANLTLAYYEKTLRKLRPYFELDFGIGGDERTSRYRGVEPFLTWLERQRKIRPRTLKISFLSPSANVLIQLKNHPASDRSYVWATGDDHATLERLFHALNETLTEAGGTWGWLRSRRFNLAFANICALTFAAGLALKLHELPWPTVLTASLCLDLGLALGLIFLFPQAWPQVEYHFADVDRAARRRRVLLRSVYITAATALTLAGVWAIFTTFIRVVW
jgi:hypothetical protein